MYKRQVDCSEFKKFSKKKARSKLGFSDNDFIVLFVGNAAWVKGLRYVAKAVKQVPNAKLAVVGIGENRLVRELLGENVLFFGSIPHSKLAEFYSASDVLCVPSVYEAFGLMYAEAACFGLPSIACKGTGAEEIIEDGRNGFLVEKRNINQIRGAIEKVAKQKSFKKPGFFSWSAVSQKVKAVYENLYRDVK